MAIGFPTKANWAAGDVLTASAMDDLAGTVNLLNPTAKGGIVAGTGANTTGVLTVGADGTTLVANSSASTGVSWGGQPYAQPVLNSAMQIWQRGTSISFTNGQRQFTSDRWEGSSTNGSGTVSRQATGDTTNLPNIQYCLRFQRTAGQTAVSGNFLAQNLESVNSIPFSGKTVTVSYYARAGANFSGTFQPVFVYGTGTDQNVYTGFTGQTTLYNTAASLTTTWQRFTFTVAVPATSTQLGFYFAHSASGTAGANDYFDTTGVQIDLGSVALPFRTYAGTLQGELTACQRYLPALVASGTETWTGFASSTTNSYVPIKFPVTARVQPTGITVSGTLSNYSLFNQGLTSAAPTAITFDSAGLDQALIYITTTAGSPTIVAGQPILFRDGTSGYLLFTGCEL